jgi:hypothetical protein
MPVVLWDLLKKALGPIAIVAVLAMIAGAFYGMHEHVQTLEAQKLDATHAASNAEAARDTANAQRDVANAAAASSALAASQVAAADAAQMTILTKQKEQAVKNAGLLAAQLTEIQNAPHTSNCALSPSVSLALRSLRDAAAADAAAGASASPADPVPNTKGGPVSAVVPVRATSPGGH